MESDVVTLDIESVTLSPVLWPAPHDSTTACRLGWHAASVHVPSLYGLEAG